MKPSHCQNLHTFSSGRLKLQDWTMTDQRKCKGGHCRTGHIIISFVFILLTHVCTCSAIVIAFY